MMHNTKKILSLRNHHLWLQLKHKVKGEDDAELLEFAFYSRRKQPLTKGHPRYWG